MPSSTATSDIDLGRVDGRVFVNNVVMGVFGAVVQSPGYRDHKVRTMVDMLPARRAARRAVRPPLHRGGGRAHDTAVLLIVSNNPYTVDPRPQHGTRGQLDRGLLGVIALTGPPPRGLEEWAAPTYRVDSATTVALGIDGENVAMEPPLLFESDQLVLRVRLPVRRDRRQAPRVRRPGAAKGRPALPDHRS